jgi:magnesium chelatase accessory protein
VPLDWSRDGADWPNRGLSRFVRTRAARWHVQRGGSGRGILLLHGAGGATHSWAGLIPCLLPDHEILAPDLPGQGFSTGAAPRFSLPHMAEDVGTLLEAVDFRPALIVGHSAGAALAARMALDGRAATAAILSLNGAFTPFLGMAGIVFPTLARMLALNPFAGALLARSAAPGLVENLIEGTGSRIDDRGRALYIRLIGTPSHVSATLAMMARWDLGSLVRDLPRLDLPVTLAVGLRDRAVPPETAEEVARLLPRAEIRAFPALGHLMHEEDPQGVAALVRQAIAAAPARP